MFQSVPQSLEYQQSSSLEHVPYKQHFLLLYYTITWTIRKLTWESLCYWEYCWWCSTRAGWCRWGWCGEECSQLSSSPSSYAEPNHHTYYYDNQMITQVPECIPSWSRQGWWFHHQAGLSGLQLISPLLWTTTCPADQSLRGVWSWVCSSLHPSTRCQC